MTTVRRFVGHIFVNAEGCCLDRMLEQHASEAADEEATGFRMMNLLLALGLRALPFPECSHQKWGDFGRAVSAAGLSGTMLKATLLVNSGTGPWASGRNQFTSRRSAELLVTQMDAEFFAELSLKVAADRGLPEGSLEVTADDFLEGVGIKTRLKKAWGAIMIVCCHCAFVPGEKQIVVWNHGIVQAAGRELVSSGSQCSVCFKAPGR